MTPIAVSDTSSLNYLILIEEAPILTHLFGRIAIPEAVRDELNHATQTPLPVKAWMRFPPKWLEIRRATRIEPLPDKLQRGEHEAMLLAEELSADYLLLDDKKARETALKRGLTVVGTLGVLEKADERGLIDLPDAIRRLRRTSFFASSELYRSLLMRRSLRTND